MTHYYESYYNYMHDYVTAVVHHICRGFITCETPENSEGVVTVMVSVDRFTGTTRENFEYVRDPVFTDIIPKFSFTS